MNLEKLKQNWASRLRVDKSTSTVENYTGAFDKFVNFLEECEHSKDPAEWDSQTMAEFDAYLVEDGLSAATRHLYESALRQLGDLLIILRIWERNRFKRIDLPSIEQGKRPDVATKPEIMRGLEFRVRGVIDKRDRALLWVLYAGALRRAEAQHLEDKDLHLDQEYIRVHGKGNKRRTVPLVGEVGKRAVQYLRSYLEDRYKFDEDKSNSYVFWGRREASGHKPLSSHTIWRICKTRTGFSCHKLRRSRLTHLAEAGVEPAYLRDFAGHASMETTMKYYVAIDEQKMANAIRRANA